MELKVLFKKKALKKAMLLEIVAKLIWFLGVKDRTKVSLSF